MNSHECVYEHQLPCTRQPHKSMYAQAPTDGDDSHKNIYFTKLQKKNSRCETAKLIPTLFCAVSRELNEEKTYRELHSVIGNSCAARARISYRPNDPQPKVLNDIISTNSTDSTGEFLLRLSAAIGFDYTISAAPLPCVCARLHAWAGNAVTINEQYYTLFFPLLLKLNYGCCFCVAR